MPYFGAQYARWRQVLEPYIVSNSRLRHTLQELPADAIICDVGAGGRRVSPGAITVDAYWGKDTDIVSDAGRLAICDEAVDCTVCTGTLEHLPNPWVAAREIARITKPGGVVYVDAPFMQGYHADPEDYWRFTCNGLKVLFPDFEEIESGVHIGPASGLCWVFVSFCQGLARSASMRRLMFRIGRIVAFPWKYLDLLMVRGPYSYLGAGGVYFVGRKRRQRLPGNSDD